MTRTITVNHLARIEGHGGITVVLDGPRVERVEFDIFEGIRLFEGLVRGRTVTEIAPIVSRVCAICSHNHAITALKALEDALGVHVSAQTDALRELAFHGGAIESHALHVFCLALPDFLGRASVLEVAEDHRDVVALALRLKKLGNTIQEVVGGRAVHPVNYVIGGFGRLPTAENLVRLRAALAAGLQDCETAAAVLGTVSIPAFAVTRLRCAALSPSVGSYFFGDQIHLDDGTIVAAENYRCLTNERVVPHSNAKHSLYDGGAYLVGALARLTLNGSLIDGTARKAWARLGPPVPSGNIIANSLAQFVELVYSVEHALAIVDRLLADGVKPETPAPYGVRPCEGTAAAEVPRGILFHRYEIDRTGRIAAADVITPTAQNLAHVEGQFQAAVRAGYELPDEELNRRLQMVARAYDPCVSCSVHVMRLGAQ